MKKLLFPILFLSALGTASAQRFGNEWINYSQTYYKMPVSTEGIFRISYADLSAAGISTSGINPKNFQVFNLGIEQHIYVNGEGDNSFDPGDYIEFYGKPNDGNTDKPIYRPQEQPHTFLSLYTDTAFYFLTWGTSPGLRMSDYTDTSFSGRTAEPYFMHNVNAFYPEQFYEGFPALQGYGLLSEYSEGEGWFGNLFTGNSTQVRTLPTPYANSSGPAPSAKILFYSFSDVGPAVGQTVNHHPIFSISPNNSSYTQLLDTTYRGYQAIRRTFPLAQSDIGNSTYFKFFIKNDLGLNTLDYNSVGGIFLSYARNYNLGGLSKFGFQLKGFNPGTENFISFTGYPSGKTDPLVYDNTGFKRIDANVSGGNLKFIVPGAGTERNIYICDASDIRSITSFTTVNFINFDFTAGAYDYIIITHDKLMQGASDYSAYRTTTGYKPLIATTTQLYDQFYYGLHHPLAIRHFCDYALEKSPTTIKYLLLLGKGQLHNLIRFDAVSYAYDYIPAFGNPGSDYMYTSGLKGTHLEPAIPTGRIPAISNSDIENYLNKVKEYELTPPALWQKNVLHLAGGRDETENKVFAGYISNYIPVIQGPFTGAISKLYSKDQAVPVSTGLKAFIQNDINSGLGMLTYIGHGASDILEIDFGGPDELKNKGKYPVMYFGGCILGNSFTKGSLGEKFLFQKDAGTIAWIANSGFGFTNELNTFTRWYYRSVAVTKYNQGIGDILKQTIADYQDLTNPSTLNMIHARQFAYEGDPALRMYFRALPDYAIPNAYLSPRDVTALSDSFAVTIIITNTGKALPDSFNISVKRTLPDNSVVNLPLKHVKSTLYSDTIYYWIKSKDVKTKGMNSFEIIVDATGLIAESDENNNRFVLQAFISTEGAQIISPLNNSIVNNVPVKLTAQANNISPDVKDFYFELDTNANFNSGFKISSPVISTNYLAIWQPSFTPSDSTVYYWRVRINQANGGEAWETASFIYISGGPAGWAQKHWQQFDKITSNSVYFDTISRRFNFERKSSVFYSVTTFGANGQAGRSFNVNYWPSRLGVIGDGIAVIAYNSLSEARYSTNSQFNPVASMYNPFPPNNKYAARTGTYWFNTNNVGNPNYQAIRDSLKNHLRSIPAGYYIFVHNGARTGVENWDTSLINAFKEIGANKITNVREGWPYYLITRKDPQPGDVIYEETADTTSGIAGDPLTQKLEKFIQFFPYVKEGSISSEWITHAKAWHTIYTWNSEKDNYRDSLYYDVLGIDSTFTQDTLFSHVTADSLDISSVSATQYPSIRVEFHYKDDSIRTVMQLKHWIVSFDPLPEGSVNPNINFSFNKDTLQEGDSLKFNIAFENISEGNFDSIDVQVKIIDGQNIEQIIPVKKLKPIRPGEYVSVGMTISTLNLKGANRLVVNFNPGTQPEMIYTNNVFSRNFYVIYDNLNPLLDVTFDSVHIHNGEVVSPVPDILITLTDENAKRPVTDTSSFKIYLIGPDGISRRIAMSSPEILFTPADTNDLTAKVHFRPARLADGEYTLIASGYDAAGNPSGANDYMIMFRVVSKASITRLYPYPNPVTSTLRFVFNITGESMPDDIKIEITTVTGQLIKTINKKDLGHLHAGTNISNVVWDGSNEYGGRQANGVYFYRVIINGATSNSNSPQTEGDMYFKNNEKFTNNYFGKIFLLR
jgi:hypothetical protein